MREWEKNRGGTARKSRRLGRFGGTWEEPWSEVQLPEGLRPNRHMTVGTNTCSACTVQVTPWTLRLAAGGSASVPWLPGLVPAPIGLGSRHFDFPGANSVN